MKIIIEYLTKRSEIRKQIEFTPDLFFDEDEDGFSIDSIPKYIFPYEYLEIEKEELILVSLLIEDNLSYVKRDMFFWNDGKNETDYYISSDEKKEIFEWMITSKQYTDRNDDEVLETIKMLKDTKGIWIVDGHWYTNLNDSDSEDLHINVFKDKTGRINGYRKWDIR